MRNYRAFLLLLFFTPFTQAEALRLSEPVASDHNSETFGKVLDQTLPIMTLAELKQDSANKTGKAFRLEARIAKVCQKKGCFFIAQKGDDVLRVKFRDYSFFIPTDSHGKTMMLNGELVAKKMSEKQAAHFRKDMKSDSEALQAGLVYEIVADSIKIPKGK